MFAAHSGDVSALRRLFYAALNFFYFQVLSATKMCITYLSPVFSIRFALSSMNMELRDYDSRTPLHVAAAEGRLFSVNIKHIYVVYLFINPIWLQFCSALGHVDVVLFLTQACKVNPFVKDRYRLLFLYLFTFSFTHQVTTNLCHSGGEISLEAMPCSLARRMW